MEGLKIFTSPKNIVKFLEGFRAGKEFLKPGRGVKRLRLGQEFNFLKSGEEVRFLFGVWRVGCVCCVL